MHILMNRSNWVNLINKKVYIAIRDPPSAKKQSRYTVTQLTVLQKVSEVPSGLRIELSNLNYLYYHVYLASKGLHELNAMQRRRFMIH